MMNLLGYIVLGKRLRREDYSTKFHVSRNLDASDHTCLPEIVITFFASSFNLQVLHNLLSLRHVA